MIVYVFNEKLNCFRRTNNNLEKGKFYRHYTVDKSERNLFRNMLCKVNMDPKIE